MKGVILAGGLGKRLYPLTKITNKHLLPVYNKPMIYYSIESLVEAGISDILIVTGGNNAGDFLRLLGNGAEFGCHLNYTYQQGEGGIAEALGLAEHFVGEDRVVVVLGDNIMEKSIASYVERFLTQSSGARIILKEVDDPGRFGMADFQGERIISIVEKPQNSNLTLAVTGVYMYDASVFQIVKRLEPSGRGELEITDVNNAYIERGDLMYDRLDGWWTDAGTFESLIRANQLMVEQVERINQALEVQSLT